MNTPPLPAAPRLFREDLSRQRVELFLLDVAANPNGANVELLGSVIGHMEAEYPEKAIGQAAAQEGK